ncbi:HAD family hydrolase [Eubacterium sp.]|uniref:HAD family hydrolase n=1 Tax=Eubacterium sp. TaxID=142586 RepID=UPI002FCA97B7
MDPLKNWKKQHDYLLCIDSDGTVMDTMDIKHQRCFGPCMIQCWNLEEWAVAIQAHWDRVNLYTVTRGINRFKGLAEALSWVDGHCRSIEGIEDLVAWVNTTEELSGQSLTEAIKVGPDKAILKQALAWHNAVNHCIDNLPEEACVPFVGVGQALEEAHSFCDIAVVSSANGKAVMDEWTRYGFMPLVDLLLTQEVGKKADCIAALLTKGYEQNHILVLGDAEGDLKAAQSNGVLFYPIQVRNEKESWEGFSRECFEPFLNLEYAGALQETQIKAFYNNLSMN